MIDLSLVPVHLHVAFKASLLFQRFFLLHFHFEFTDEFYVTAVKFGFFDRHLLSFSSFWQNWLRPCPVSVKLHRNSPMIGLLLQIIWTSFFTAAVNSFHNWIHVGSWLGRSTDRLDISWITEPLHIFFSIICCTHLRLACLYRLLRVLDFSHRGLELVFEMMLSLRNALWVVLMRLMLLMP